MGCGLGELVHEGGGVSANWVALVRNAAIAGRVGLRPPRCLFLPTDSYVESARKYGDAGSAMLP